MKQLAASIFIFITVTVATVAIAADIPVKVQSASMKYFGDEFRSSFIGNVVATSAEYTLTADQADVYFSKDNKITAVRSKGNVSFKSSDILAVSNEAELDQRKKTIVLKGQVKVWQKDNYLEGESVVLSYDTKEISIDKGDSEKVTIIFNPDSAE